MYISRTTIFLSKNETAASLMGRRKPIIRFQITEQSRKKNSRSGLRKRLWGHRIRGQLTQTRADSCEQMKTWYPPSIIRIHLVPCFFVKIYSWRGFKVQCITVYASGKCHHAVPETLEKQKGLILIIAISCDVIFPQALSERQHIFPSVNE